MLVPAGHHPMKPIYLDYNATTPVDPVVAEAMLPYLREHFGNPSSSHGYGVQAKRAVERARRQVADLLGCSPDEVIFTSGGSESNNMAIKGIARANRARGNHIVTSAVEHPAVVEVCRALEAEGLRITFVPVDGDGLVGLSDLEEALTPATILVTVMHANNEVGTIQPIPEIARLARERGIPMHTDAAQSVGKVPVRVDDLGVDLLSLAGHKLYAPKGVGALYVRRGIRLEKLIHGADHEQNRRAGTENVPEIVALGMACEVAGRDLERNAEHMRAMRDRLAGGLERELGEIRMNGHPERRLPNTLSVSFRMVEANTLLSEIEEVAASAGAACHSDQVDVSPVLEAMGVPVEFAMGTVRFSTGRETREEDIDRAVEAVSSAVRRLRPSGEVGGEAAGPDRPVKLTQYTHGLGCACKLRPQLLEKILADLPRPDDPRVLVGTDTADDAAVYLLDERTALIQTVDFFTPVVDDPYDFGAIAAANSLSDIYAMGGRPLFALNIVGFPSNRLPLWVLERILAGALDKVNEAGIHILGGHSVEDTEPKYGLAVTGVCDPRRILRNVGARPGDALVLTKPIGLGILTTAIKRGLAEEPAIRRAVDLMGALNREAAEVASEFPVSACTDVTGFGLLGHLWEMSSASGLDAVIHQDRVPVLEGARELAAAGAVPGGTLSNESFVSEAVRWLGPISRPDQLLLADPQTSGGLLMAVGGGREGDLVGALHDRGVTEAAVIGMFTERGAGKITVR